MVGNLGTSRAWLRAALGYNAEVISRRQSLNETSILTTLLRFVASRKSVLVVLVAMIEFRNHAHDASPSRGK